MIRPGAWLLNLIAAATFAMVAVLQLTNGHSDGRLSLVASVLLLNAARTAPRRKPDADG